MAFDMVSKRRACLVHEVVFGKFLFLCYQLWPALSGTRSFVIPLISLLSHRFRLLKTIETTGVQSHLLLVYGDRCHL